MDEQLRGLPELPLLCAIPHVHVHRVLLRGAYHCTAVSRLSRQCKTRAVFAMCMPSVDIGTSMSAAVTRFKRSICGCALYVEISTLGQSIVVYAGIVTRADMGSSCPK